jgi:tetratricopeptide (TPR) repeat protein
MVVSPPEESSSAVPNVAVEAAIAPASAVRQLHPGLLVDMRDGALGRLLEAPADVETMDSLVRIQRHLAADNSEMLRFGAAVYARAVRAGAPTSEHLSPQAMRLLVLANLLAATEIETQAGGLAPVKRTPPSAAPDGLRLRAPKRLAGPSAPRARIAVARRPEYFLVVSGPLTIQQGQSHVRALAFAGLTPVLRRTGDGQVQVQVGAFASKVNAEALAARVRRRGLTVSVVVGRAGTAFEPVRPLPSPAASRRPAGRAQSFDDLMDRGVRLYGPGWYGPALASFREAARIRPDSARAHLWWGRAAFKVLRHREARGALLRALALSRDAEVARQAHLLLRAMREPNAFSTAPGTD